MAYANLAQMFYDSETRHPQAVAMMHKVSGTWEQLTFHQICAEARELAAGLAEMGVKRGDRLVILGENSYRWALSDFAILTHGAVTIPVYPTLLSSHIQYIINDCGARVAFVSDADQFAKILEIEEGLPQLKRFVLFNSESVSHPNAINYEELLQRGRAFLAANPDFVAESVSATSRDDLATFVYTSGTTGEPKGVMLTHGNLLSNIEDSLKALAITQEDLLLSFLPLSHIFERMVGHFLANFVGGTIAYAESIDKVPENLLEVRPTLMASVPRLFEKIYAKVLAGVEEGSDLKQKIFRWAIGVGLAVTECRQKNQPVPGMLGLKNKIAHKLVFSKLHERVGGRIQFFVSGGAPLPKEIGEFFTAAGLLILEGYGLTETSPVISVNRLDKFKFGTVGVPIENVEVRIAEDGEILSRGPNTMAGYYNKPEETREAIDKDGWFHTGDIGEFDEEGFLRITDRKKNIIVTAGGKNVAPQKIENLLVTTRYIEQALVLGDRRKFCSAVLVPDFAALEKYCAEHQLQCNGPSDMARNPQILELMREEVERVNRECASYESIKKFIVIEKPFSIETGELTPSLKVKRKVVEQNYQPQINALYE